MCGRFASARKRAELLEEFSVQRDRAETDLAPDYNVAPTKRIYTVLTRRSGSSDDQASGTAASGGTAAAGDGASGGTAAEARRRSGSAALSASCGSCAGGWCPTGPRTGPSAAA